MVLIFEPDYLPDPGTPDGPMDLNVRYLFVVPYRLWSKVPLISKALPLKLPIENVIVSWTNTPECETEGECTKAVWDLQRHYLDLGQDIPYNFVVGGDANVYECRGWKLEPDKCDRHPGLEGNTIEIAHIGFKGDEGQRPQVGMALSVTNLCDYGIKEGWIIEMPYFLPDYEILYGTVLSKKNKHKMSKSVKVEDDWYDEPEEKADINEEELEFYNPDIAF